MDLDEIFVITRLHSFNYWRVIYEILKKEIFGSCLINPFEVDKALLKLQNGKFVDFEGSRGVWKKVGGIHILIETWCACKHGRLEMIETESGT